MNVATGGRDPSLLQYVLRGVAFLVVLAIMFVLLFMRYDGQFDSNVPVVAEMTDIGDGLITDADVRYNGLIVGEVKSVALSGDTDDAGQQIKRVEIDIDPDQAEGIPAGVTARTVPSNLFGVNSVELVPPRDSGDGRVEEGTAIAADTSLDTIRLQDAQNELRLLLDSVPPEDLAQVLGVISNALHGGGAVFGNFVGVLNDYFEGLNDMFPEGAPPGFNNFNDSVRGLSQSAPQLLDTLGRSVIPAMTIAESRRDITALLTSAQSVTDEVQELFARNADGGQRLVRDLNTTLGATMLEPDALPQALTALNNLAARVLTVFTGVNGRVQLNVGLSFSPYIKYNRQNCPVYDGGPYGQARGPGCTGPGTGTGPTSSGPLLISPSDGMRRTGFPGAGSAASGPSPAAGGAASPAGAVTTGSDNETLQTALQREPNPADTLMLGPLVQGVSATQAASPAANKSNSSSNEQGGEG